MSATPQDHKPKQPKKKGRKVDPDAPLIVTYDGAQYELDRDYVSSADMYATLARGERSEAEGVMATAVVGENIMTPDAEAEFRAKYASGFRRTVSFDRMNDFLGAAFGQFADLGKSAASTPSLSETSGQ